MRRVTALLLGLLLFCLPSFAQTDAPVVELSGAYSYLRFSSTKSNFNGGSFSIAVNPHPWLGLVADIGGYHQSVISGFESANLVSYLFGPRLYYRRDERITPYVHVLFGGAYDTAISRNALALAAGGGFDVKIAPHVALRLAQADYFMSRFGSETQNNVRISTGLVFRFGGK